MSTVPHAVSGALRDELERLPCDERFERLAALGKSAPPDERAAIEALRVQLADRVLAELGAAWGPIPFKAGVLRLSSKKTRAALGNAAKRARDRHIEAVMAAGGPPLGGRVAGGHRFATGLDERAVELPLALESAALHQPGAVLDAGAALNVPVVRAVVGRPAARVTHFTLPGVVEPVLPGHEDRFSHASGDLRAMSFADGVFDRVVSVSTLEHVGMDNSRYGAGAERDPASAAVAVRELVRVLAAGGELLLTVPYGQAADHGWFRVFDADALAALVEPASGHAVALRYFYYDAGWMEAGPAPSAPVRDAGFAPDVITGVAVARIVKAGGPS
jgi:hypothetical protein